MELFGSRGAGSTSVRDVAAAAGVTLATVHHYFGTKQALLEHCAQHALRQLLALRDAVAEQVQADSTPAEAVVRAITTTCFRFGVEHRSETRFLLRLALFERDSPARQPLNESQRVFLDTASKLIAGFANREPDELRVPLQGLMFLLTRMAVTSESELTLISGSREKALQAFERYVGDVAVATLLAPETALRAETAKAVS